MSQSLNLTSAASLQAYVRDYYDVLISKMFMGFPTAQICTPHEGVKGQEVLTELQLGNLIRRYSPTFSVVNNTHSFVPKILTVHKNKVDLRIIPEQFETSYLGRHRQKGQNDMDLPFEGQLLMKSIEKISAEMEIAMWQAVQTTTPSNNDVISQTFNGFAKIISDNIGDLAPVVSGGLTANNAYTTIEAVFMGLASQYQDAGVDIILNPKTYQLAIQEYREKYKFYVARPNGQPGFDLAANVNYLVLPGVPDNLIVATPRENLHYGYDSNLDHRIFNFEQEDRSIKIWNQFNIGAQIGIIAPEILGVNVVSL
jgi:hypothetical protein